jgi:RNase H-fold protein (predicted Holliday junction resolvase)
MILAIDPGKEKCGIAVLDKSGKILENDIVPRLEVKATVYHYLSKHNTTSIVVGRSAFGKEVEKELSRLDIKANIIFVSEKYSTLEARKRYWKDNRPKGLWRLIPRSLQVPPVPVDDYAAVILGERYLKS